MIAALLLFAAALTPHEIAQDADALKIAMALFHKDIDCAFDKFNAMAGDRLDSDNARAAAAFDLCEQDIRARSAFEYAWQIVDMTAADADRNFEISRTNFIRNISAAAVEQRAKILRSQRQVTHH